MMAAGDYLATIDSPRPAYDIGQAQSVRRTVGRERGGKGEMRPPSRELQSYSRLLRAAIARRQVVNGRLAARMI